MAGTLAFLYSDPTGAGTNTDPAKSLGGVPSSYSIVGTTIFGNVSDAQSQSGAIHYRCIYVSNDTSSTNVYSGQLYISDDVVGGADVSLGFKVADERQVVTLTNFSTITGGYLDVTYNRDVSYPLTVNWDATPATFASNFQTQLNTIDGLEDVTVSGSYDSGLDIITFQIDFILGAGSRFHEIMVVDSTNLTYTGGLPIPTVERNVAGSPINTETVDVSVETTPPSGIIFGYTTFDLNTFRALDIIPVWIRRVVAAGTSGLKNDGFTLRVKGFSTP